MRRIMLAAAGSVLILPLIAACGKAPPATFAGHCQMVQHGIARVTITNITTLRLPLSAFTVMGWDNGVGVSSAVTHLPHTWHVKPGHARGLWVVTDKRTITCDVTGFTA